MTTSSQSPPILLLDWKLLQVESGKVRFFLADVSTKLKNKNVTTDVKVDTNSNLLTTITVDEAAPGLKTIFSFTLPDQKSGKVELQYQHDYAGINTSSGLTASPVVNISGVLGNNLVSVGSDVSFDTATDDFIKYNAGLNVTHADLIASLTLNDRGDTLNASYYHVVSPLTNTVVGVEFSHSFSSNENIPTINIPNQPQSHKPRYSSNNPPRNHLCQNPPRQHTAPTHRHRTVDPHKAYFWHCLIPRLTATNTSRQGWGGVVPV